METKIKINGWIDKFHGYRTARVTDPDFVITLDDSDFKFISDKLTHDGSYKMDNHIVFGTTNESLYYQVSDNKLLIGTKLKFGNW